jgi:hypothetical protein
MEKLVIGVRDKYNLNFDLVDNGDLIKEKIDSNDYWKIKEAEKILDDSECRHLQNEHKKWLVAFFVAIFGGVLAYYITIYAYALMHTAYDRSYLDSTISSMLDGYNYTDLITEEPLFIGYSFNVQEPRFYSKFMIEKEPEIYSISLTDSI